MPTTSNEGGDASSGTQPSMITVPVNIPLPERMDLSGGNLPANDVDVDAYVTCTALQKLAKTCNYGSLTDSHIRDRMVVGINDNSASTRLLQTSKLTLGQCIDICISLQTSARQLKEMNIKRMSVS